MNEINKIVEDQRKFFNSGTTKSIEFRKKMLKALRKAITDHEDEIMKALKEDLNKSAFEAYETEVGIVLEELNFMLKNIDKLSAPKRVKTPLVHFPSVCKVYKDPKGVVLIMAPWNYPFQLTLAPLVGAIAAGNCAVLKPSNYAPSTSRIIREIIGDNFEKRYITVVEGGREANQTLLDIKFDHIFFTGGVTVGKLVMKQASEHLTPVTLELGGKSPCIVDKTANIPLAGKRIAWGKFLNAGQTCVAPDYILVHESKKDELIQEIIRNIHLFYGEDPIQNEDYPKIINQKHFERLSKLLDNGKLAEGGTTNPGTRQIAPAILDDVSWDMPVMQEEIFGPVLPVLTFESLGEVVKKVNSRPKPLALYYFTTSRVNRQRILKSITFGGGCINDTIVHLASSYFAFGGVGESGMGSYHGDESFRTFSHSKSVLKKSNLIDIPLRYPPFKNHLQLLKKILK